MELADATLSAPHVPGLLEHLPIHRYVQPLSELGDPETLLQRTMPLRDSLMALGKSIGPSMVPKLRSILASSWWPPC